MAEELSWLVVSNLNNAFSSLKNPSLVYKEFVVRLVPQKCPNSGRIVGLQCANSQLCVPLSGGRPVICIDGMCCTPSEICRSI
ncbi:hypothetical protein WUBG_09418 [Wuchereria bancrofti]|uniref:Uncharacterized protein n=1 Tax=Wuchereria bancrofti TaxID=6293 RepID=J9EBZ1_WUCBA|nr:hypothetical protein WUBG_09418 [Wuchereria bancrofti]